MAVTATVLSVCTIVTTPLVFGNYTSTTLDGTASLTVVCTPTTTFNVGLNAGVGVGASIATRMMSNGSAVLAYSLYSDPARSILWGNTVGTDTAAGTGNGLTQLLTVYGRIPAGQSAAPGVYTDVVIATVTY